MNKPCPICSQSTEPWAQGLIGAYNHHNIGRFCDSCSKKASSFLSYWGEKREEDKELLFEFISNGDEPQKKLRSMMNAGYF